MMFDFLRSKDPEMEIAKLLDEITLHRKYILAGVDYHVSALKIERCRRRIETIEKQIKGDAPIELLKAEGGGE